jgi:hypothetical protein
MLKPAMPSCTQTAAEIGSFFDLAGSRFREKATGFLAKASMLD